MERPFLVDLVEPETGESLNMLLKGYIDFREADGTIHELKTSARAISEAEVASHLQLICYAYALWKETGVIPGLKLAMLVKTKKPRLEFLETTRSFKDLTRFYRLAEQVLKGIDASIFYPNPTFGSCGCEYEQWCRGWCGYR